MDDWEVWLEREETSAKGKRYEASDDVVFLLMEEDTGMIPSTLWTCGRPCYRFRCHTLHWYLLWEYCFRNRFVAVLLFRQRVLYSVTNPRWGTRTAEAGWGKQRLVWGLEPGWGKRTALARSLWMAAAHVISTTGYSFYLPLPAAHWCHNGVGLSKQICYVCDNNRMMFAIVDHIFAFSSI